MINSSINPVFDSQSLTLTMSGPFTAAQSVTALVKRVGSIVVIELPAVSATAANAVASAASGAGAIPASLRPAATIYAPLNIVNNSVILPACGKLELTAAGTLSVYLDLLGTGLWTALGNAGWQRTSLVYTLA